MTERKTPIECEGNAPDDEEIEAAARRLSAAWASGPDAHRVTETGRIKQTLEKGRSHSVAVEVRRSRRRPAPAPR